jgi:thymidine kinase
MSRLEPGSQDRMTGQIEVITGGMFSGKSEELVRRLRRAVIARQNVQAFKPAADTRHSPARLITRDNREVAASAVEDSAEMARFIRPGVQVVGVDEAQFFDDGLVELATELADRGVRVILAGLDQDFMRRPFGPMPKLLCLAEFVDKMHAICVVCGLPAHFTQRIAGGSELVQVGDSDAYEARCRICYELGLQEREAVETAAEGGP